ncbi:MAG: hypothetical protein U0575_06425 [Phycisphaerales bacterium]
MPRRRSIARSPPTPRRRAKAHVGPAVGVVVDGDDRPRAAGEHVLGDPRQQQDVAADVRLEVLVGDGGAEEERPRIARHAELDQSGFADWTITTTPRRGA